jgi:hypothetical protein
MLIWQTLVLFTLAACAICCLLGIYRAIEKLAKGILSVGAEITKMNAKLETIEAVNRDDPAKPMDRSESDTALEDIESAISKFEKLKRIDLTTPVEAQGKPGNSGENCKSKPTSIFSYR